MAMALIGVGFVELIKAGKVAEDDDTFGLAQRYSKSMIIIIIRIIKIRIHCAYERDLLFFGPDSVPGILAMANFCNASICLEIMRSNSKTNFWSSRSMVTLR